MKNIDFIQSVVDYIDENMSEALDLDAIAVATGYSKYHLCRMFAFCTGYSIHEYVRRRRLHQLKSDKEHQPNMNKEFRDADEYCNRPDQQGFRQSYIPSGHVGLFERYGYSYVTEITNYGGECEHLFVKRI